MRSQQAKSYLPAIAALHRQIDPQHRVGFEETRVDHRTCIARLEAKVSHELRYNRLFRVVVTGELDSATGPTVCDAMSALLINSPGDATIDLAWGRVLGAAGIGSLGDAAHRLNSLGPTRYLRGRATRRLGLGVGRDGVFAVLDQRHCENRQHARDDEHSRHPPLPPAP